MSFAQILQQEDIPFDRNVALKKYTTFRIGGDALYFVSPRSIEQAQRAMALCLEHGITYRILGKGSNVLISDAGINGAVIYTAGLCKIENNGEYIKAECGVPLARLLKVSQGAGLSGLEKLAGIPGSVGGAIYMNAGAYGQSISDYIEQVDLWLPKASKLDSIEKSRCLFSYRQSVFMKSEGMITSALFRLSPASPNDIQQAMTDILRQRAMKQPLSKPSAGSVFRRPPNAYASKVIDECGLKGKRFGDAMVSHKHAGFIVNMGRATYLDVVTLIDFIRQTVFVKTGILLETEIEMW